MGRPTLTYTQAGAQFDPRRRYRYRLWRRWGFATDSFVTWIMLNPSTADEHTLDPTLRRVQAYSAAWNFKGFDVVNLYALRSTDPKRILTSWAPIGLHNDEAIIRSALGASLVMVGWGSEHEPRVQARAAYITMALHKRGVRLKCLKFNVDRSPSHPLYLAKTLLPRPY